MAGELLQPGENTRLQQVPQENVRVRLSVTGGAPLRLLGILLDENGKPVGPAPLLTWRAPGDGVEIKLNKGETISAVLHTAALHEPIQSIMFVVAPYARNYFSPGERIFTAIASEGVDPIAIESIAPDGMQTLALCDFYRHPQQGAKIRARDEWRHREITTLLERLGIPTKILTDQMLYPLPHMRHTEKDRASLNTLLQGEPAPAQIPADEVAGSDLKPGTADTHETKAAEAKPEKEADTIYLDQIGAQARLSARGSHFGKVEINLCWHQLLATRAAVRLDVGCFWELQDGKKGQLEGLSTQHGSLSAPPFISLTGETLRSGALCHEKIMINGDQWGQIRRILLYAMIHEGPLQWDPLDARVTLLAPDQKPVHMELITDNKSGPIAALMLIENRSDQMRIAYPGGFFESHYALDAAFDFQLRWRTNTAQPPGAASEKDWAPPAPMNFWRKWLGIMFGSTMYNNAEDLMRAALSAAAMVMVADGQVSVEERKHVIQEVMSLPMGNMFAEYEVRNGLENILRDLKTHRKESEHLTIQLISAYRGHQDAKVIVQAMRRAAMVDGQVNIQEERMVERLTRYLKSHND